MSREREIWERPAFLAALALVLSLLQAPGLLLGETLDGHDLRHHHLPWRAWAARRWAEGEIPLWSDAVGGGFPLFADGQVGALYPPNIILGLLPPDVALTLGILLHFVLAFFGGRALAGRAGAGPAGAVLAGAVLSVGGFQVAHVTYAGFHAVCAWAPWLMSFALDLARGKGRGPAFGLVVAISLLAGHPQAAVIALVGAGLAFVAARPVAWLPAVGWSGVGLAVASAQVAATGELARLSARGGGVEAGFAGIGSLPPWELINVVLPRFWGFEPPASIPLSYVHKGAAFFGSGENWWEDCIYVGFPVLVLALSAARRHRGWAALAGLGLLLALGRYTPAWELLRHLPPFDHFRFPARFGMLFSLGAAVLAARGLEAPPRPRVALGIAALLLVGGVLGRVALSALEEPVFGLIAGREGPERAQAVIEGMRWNGGAGLVWPLLSLGLLAAALRRPSWLPAVVMLDLLVALHGVNRTAKLDLHPPTIAAKVDPAGRYAVVDRVVPEGLDREIMTANLGLLWGVREVFVPSPLVLPDHEALLARAGLDVGLDHGPAKVDQVLQNLHLAQLLEVRTLVSVHEIPGLTKIQDGEVKAYRLPALPTACKRLSSGDELLRLRCPRQEAGLSSLGITLYPGWEARVEGRLQPLVPVEGALAGIALPAGAEEVELRYSPWWKPLIWAWAVGFPLLLLGALRQLWRETVAEPRLTPQTP